MKIWTRVVTAALCIASAAAFTAACGDDSDNGSSSSTGGGNSGNGGGFQAFQSCLSKNGVEMTMPSGMPGGGFPSGAPGAPPSGMPGGGMLQKPAGVDDATWQKAQAACASVMPSFGPGMTQDNGAISAYLNCLSNHGVSASAQPQALNTADPTVSAAQQACVALRPSGMPSGG
ncbi:hypothetical protein [Actinoplanes subtropicus]|uniref:hypothetical protein n=1 Tax=Actinoplanes subtropicus TaxID=543632 RepID=UPI0012F96BAE|nr:hypothetical protein [Actinoplanes subtropicus]